MAVQRYIEKSFFKKWNNTMAYALGFLYADGTITHNNRGAHYFSFHSTDKEILSAIKTAMRSTHKISKRSERSGSVYRIQVGSKEMVGDLLALGLTTGKARRMRFPVIPKRCLPHFLRGYFDGDGNVWVGDIHRERKNSARVIMVAFTSASASFLRYLQTSLKEHGVQGGSLYRLSGKECARLSFAKRDSLKIYRIMYNSGAFGSLYLKRKKDVFDAFVKNAGVA